LWNSNNSACFIEGIEQKHQMHGIQVIMKSQYQSSKHLKGKINRCPKSFDLEIGEITLYHLKLYHILYFAP